VRVKLAGLIAAAGLLALSGCALPVISTDLDPGTTRKVKRTGTNFAGTTDLPRKWGDNDLKYMGREEAENLVRRQGALKGGD
jgi:hypothetical protein